MIYNGYLYPFGNTQAAVNLAKIFQEREPEANYIRRRFTSFIQHFNVVCQNILTMEADTSVRRYLLDLSYLHKKNRWIRSCQNLQAPKIIVDHSLNVLNTKYKISVRKLEQEKKLSKKAKEDELIFDCCLDFYKNWEY